MKSTRRAVIDVGTNSVKLLVADVAGRMVQPVWEESRQTRLGQGFYETNRLQDEPIAYSANAVADFARAGRERGAQSVRAIATSAARDAVNGEDLVSAIEAAAGLKVEILAGEQEAEWGFRGVTSDPKLARQPLLLLDVGGGSTQMIVGQGEAVHFCKSYNLGTVRLLERIPQSDPPKAQELGTCQAWLKEYLQKQVRPQLAPALQSEVSPGSSQARQILLVGVGGTASILARMEGKMDQFDRERIEGTRLSLARLRWHVEHLWGLPLQERRDLVGLPRNRADVILPGVAIYEAVMVEFGFGELRVSTRGLRFAAVMDGV